MGRIIFQRKVNQSIEVDGPARITILSTTPSGRVEVAVEADREVTIDRSEVADRKRAERRNGKAA